MLLILPSVTTLAGNTTPRKLLQLKQISALRTRNRLWILPSNFKMDTPIKLFQYKKICRQYWYPTKHLRENTSQVNLISGVFSAPSLLNGNIKKYNSSWCLPWGRKRNTALFSPPSGQPVFLEPCRYLQRAGRNQKPKNKGSFSPVFFPLYLGK